MSTQTSTPPTTPEPLTDEQSARVAAWWEAHGPALRAFARRRLADAEAAEDVVQEAMLSAAVAVGRGEQAQSEKALLFTVLRRRVVDHVRKSARTRRVADELAEIVGDPDRRVRDQVYAVAAKRWGGPPESAMQREEFWAAFEACLDAMPLLMRQAMILREIDGLDTDECCRTLDVSKANLWTLVHRARLRLREELTPLMVRE